MSHKPFKSTLTLAEKMRHFAKPFSDTEWEALCRNQKFLDGFSEDPDSVRVLAEEILAKIK